MPGTKWTASDVDLAFLLHKVPAYSEVHRTGKARVKNHARDAFLANTVAAYEFKFPGRLASMDLPGIGLGGTPEERRDVFKEVSFHTEDIPPSLPLNRQRL